MEYNKFLDIIHQSENNISQIFKKIDKIAFYNQCKVIEAFKKNQISLTNFTGTSGYGYNDLGREKLDNLVSDIFKAEKAICSPYIVSGTHAISLCLYSLLKPRDTILSISGKPYDTIYNIINDCEDSLLSKGINFKYIELINNNFNIELITQELLSDKNIKMIYIQRSKGYEFRQAIDILNIKSLVTYIKSLKLKKEVIIMVDNCYTTFTNIIEPIEIGANIIAGSLIKNLGGGLAPTGGFIAGDQKYLNIICNKLTTPSIKRECGSYIYGYHLFFEGIFLAPHIVSQAMKGKALMCDILKTYNIQYMPNSNDVPNDIVTAIVLNDKDKLINFMKYVQQNSPVDSQFEPIPEYMPGYNDDVIMAAGCFIQGASIELSADATVKEPYICYIQGGLTYEHYKYVIYNLLEYGIFDNNKTTLNNNNLNNDDNNVINMYTDGSCDIYTGNGGYCAIIIDKNNKKTIISGGYKNTTNNRMELISIIKGLKTIQYDNIVNIYSDSAYVVNAFNLNWIFKWQTTNWQKIKNVDLWQQLYSLYKMYKKINFIKIKGHADNIYNNECDKIARQNMQNL